MAFIQRFTKLALAAAEGLAKLAKHHVFLSCAMALFAGLLFFTAMDSWMPLDDSVEECSVVVLMLLVGIMISSHRRKMKRQARANGERSQPPAGPCTKRAS